MAHKPAARVGDATSCPKDQPVEHKGGKISAGSSNITINGKPAARVGDAISGCEDGSEDVITEGSGCVTFNGKPAAFLGNATDHGGEITAGSGNVFIGNSGGKIVFGDYGVIKFGDYGKIYLGGDASIEPMSSLVPPADAIDTILDAAVKISDAIENIPYVRKVIAYVPLPHTKILKVPKALKAAKSGVNALKAGKMGATGNSSAKTRGVRTKNRLPEGKKGDLGPSNGTLEKRNPQTGKLQQTRTYDAKGKPLKNLDFDHDHKGSGTPHAHDWKYKSPHAPNPSRGAPRPLKPGELK
jgi:uncharacterized Zn-binding protein involved in type VI secretion